MTQTEAVLDWLQRRPLTALEALQHLGCFRLAARVEELRRLGHNIITQDYKVGQKTVARYILTKGIEHGRQEVYEEATGNI